MRRRILSRPPCAQSIAKLYTVSLIGDCDHLSRAPAEQKKMENDDCDLSTSDTFGTSMSLCNVLVYRRWLSGLRVLLPFCNLSLVPLGSWYFLFTVAASRSSSTLALES